MTKLSLTTLIALAVHAVPALAGVAARDVALWDTRGSVAEVPYVIDASAEPSRADIESAVAVFAAGTVVRWVPRTNEPDYVRFVIAHAISKSHLGRKGGEQILLLAPNRSVPIILHEMGHAVGLMHEHQHPDRARHLDINWENVEVTNIGNFLPTCRAVALGAYDLDSIMHYGSREHAKDKRVPVLSALDPARAVEWKETLSAGDAAALREMYFGSFRPGPVLPEGADEVDRLICSFTSTPGAVADLSRVYQALRPFLSEKLGGVSLPPLFDPALLARSLESAGGGADLVRFLRAVAPRVAPVAQPTARCPLYTQPLYHYFHFANAGGDAIARQWHAFYQSLPAPVLADRTAYATAEPFACLPVQPHGGAKQEVFFLYSPFRRYADQRVYLADGPAANRAALTYGLQFGAVYRTLRFPSPGTVPLVSCTGPAVNSQRVLSLQGCRDVAWAGFFTVEAELGHVYPAR